MLSKRRQRDKAEAEEENERPDEEGERDITERLRDAEVGPLRMSDRRSGDLNMFGDKIQSCTVQLSKLNPDLTRSVLGRQRGVEAEAEAAERIEEEKEEADGDNESQGPAETISAIKEEDSEKKIRDIVDSSGIEEMDITSQIDILDTSKKKIEEIRKSQEQISQQLQQEMEVDHDNNKPGDVPEKKENDEDKKDISEDQTAPGGGVPVPDKCKDTEIKDKWKEGEKILCFHGPLIYEAKIQQVEVQNGIPKYFIHYRGWNKNWDEWVPEARMMKYCDHNVEIQKDLCLAHEAKESSKKVKLRQDHVFAVPKNPSPIPKKEEKGRRKAGAKPKKRDEGGGAENFLIKNGKQMSLCPPDNTVESEEQYKTKLEIKIRIPEELKSYIVDDWVQVCNKKRLVVLPAKITADGLLSEYTRIKTANKAEKMKNNKEKAILEVTAGIREYFNVMLASQLLYKQERPQYEQAVKADPGMIPCKTYGVVHLLRLFTKLGEILIYTPLGEKSINILLFYINDILMYIKKNASLLFSLSDYSPEVQ